MSTETEAMLEPTNMTEDRSVTRRILRGALTVGSLTLLVKVVGFTLSVVVASVFARGGAYEAFLLAMILPMLVSGIVGGAFHQAGLPIYVRLRNKEGALAADRLFRQCICVAMFVLLTVGGLLFFAGPWLIGMIAGDADPERLRIAVGLMRWLTPLYLLSTLPEMLPLVLHAEERFSVVSLAQAAVPLTTLGALLFYGSSRGVFPLVCGALVGSAIQGSVLLMAIRVTGHRFPWRLPLPNTAFRETVAQWLPAAGGMVFQQVTILVDQGMAAHLSQGSVASLAYAYRLIALPLGLATVSISTAILPVLADLAGRERWSGFWQSTARWMRAGLLAGILPAILLACISRPLIALIYQRGQFGVEDTLDVASVLVAYAGMIPFYIIGVVGVRALSILGLNRVILVISILNLITNIVGNLVFSRYLGVSGIALSTTVVYLISALIIVVTLIRRHQRVPTTDRMRSESAPK
jgi:putative peptidoglycan lipid II flippase